VDLSKLSREDWMVGGGAFLLIIDLLFLPWHSVSAFGVSADFSGTDAPGSIWGVLALIVTIVVLVDLALARFSPATQMPTTQLGRDMTRTAAAGLALLLVLIKLIDNTSFLAYGTWVGIVLAVVVVAGAWFNAQGRSTPIGTHATGTTGPTGPTDPAGPASSL
jgi:hypothetical protein